MNIIEPVFGVALDVAKIWFSLAVLGATALALGWGGYKLIRLSAAKINRKVLIGWYGGAAFGFVSGLGSMWQLPSLGHWSGDLAALAVVVTVAGVIGAAFGALIWWLRR